MYPYMLYGNLIWGRAAKVTLHAIERLQNIAVRLILNIKRMDKLSPIYKKEQIIRVKDLNKYVTTIFMHKLVNRKLPILFEDMFIKKH